MWDEEKQLQWRHLILYSFESLVTPVATTKSNVEADKKSVLELEQLLIQLQSH
jgi:hypothetical protein